MRNIDKTTRGYLSIFYVLVIVIILITALSVSASSGPGEPDPGTVAGVGTRTFYLAAITGTNTVYATSARETGNNDVHAWHSMDVFAHTDISGTGAITITPQFSPDNMMWITPTYKYVGYTTTTSVLTSSGTTTATTSVATSEQTGNYQIILDADEETGYFKIPVTGYYMRFMIMYTGTMTPTIRAVARND